MTPTLWAAPAGPPQQVRLQPAAGQLRIETTPRSPPHAEGEPQHFLFPVLAAAQLINVSRPGQEPDLLAAHEDMTLWDPALTARGGGPMSAPKRQRFFDCPANLTGREIGSEYVGGTGCAGRIGWCPALPLPLLPSLQRHRWLRSPEPQPPPTRNCSIRACKRTRTQVWTLHIWQSLIDFSSYKLGLPGVPMSIDLVPLLDAQPLQIMAKHRAVRPRRREAAAALCRAGSARANCTVPVCMVPALPRRAPHPCLANAAL